MRFLVIVRARLDAPYAQWLAAFDREREDREAHGVETVFRAPVVGEQAVVFAMRTTSPRLVHDMMYSPAVRSGIEASGLVVGSETLTICEDA